jgi:hypothetical protein
LKAGDDKAMDGFCYVDGTVKNIILQLIGNWKRDFGQKLVHYAVGFITFSKAGID